MARKSGRGLADTIELTKHSGHSYGDCESSKGD